MNESYVVLGPSINHPLVEAWSKERLPFEPKGWKLQFRNDVREALRRLSFVPDSNLAALYVSPVAQYCDVENIVFYNVGSASFAHLQCKAVRFERVFSQPPSPPNSAATRCRHYLSYALINRERGSTYWEPVCLLAKWDRLPCGILTSSSKVASVWHRFKLGIGAHRVQRLSGSEVTRANLGLKVTVHVPEKARLNLTSVIKPLFDGVVAAFNKHDGSCMKLVTERIATELGIDEKEAACLLGDGTVAILGSRRLVWPWRHSIQWNPGDDLLVAGELSLADYAPEREWELSGELFEVHQTKS